MKKQFLLVSGLFLCLIVFNSCVTQKKLGYQTDKSLLQTIDKNFTDADAQYKVMMKLLPPDRFPKTFENGKLETSGSGWWCSGFYPGTLFYIYEQNKDAALYNEALRILQPLEKEQYNKGTHDLGFMMYCSFGNANRISPKPEYKEVIINSAKSLSTRFNPAVGCIKSWNSKPGDFLVIIDNMMNLELLFEATKLTGDSSFYHIAVTHANTTIKNHFRPDYSSYHVVVYDTATGKKIKGITHQGYSDNSMWARGQSWAIYGYTMVYRETKDERFLDFAQKVTDVYLERLPKDLIPYWDFDDPSIPNAPRDASVACVVASALLELSRFVKDESKTKLYQEKAEAMLKELSAHYQSRDVNNAFLLHSTGHKPAGSEIDASIIYADYYYIEALLREKKLKEGKSIYDKL